MSFLLLLKTRGLSHVVWTNLAMAVPEVSVVLFLVSAGSEVSTAYPFV